MNIIRNEIRTGVLVIVTVGILVFVLLLLGAPGVFTPMNTYYVYFDNAAGLNPGASVYVAGRKVGQVKNIFSPIPEYARPADHPEDEVLVEVNVDRNACIDKKVTVRMLQLTLMSASVIDFSGGDDSSGLAPNKMWFLGERTKGFAEAVSSMVKELQNVITPLAKEATKTMETLRLTSDNLKALTASGSKLDQSLENFRILSANLDTFSAKNGPLFTSLENFRQLTGPDSKLSHSLQNIDALTSSLVKDDRIDKTLAEFQATAKKLQSTVDEVSPRLNSTVENADQLMDTLKRQPWRLIWPSTKHYDDSAAPLRNSNRSSR